MAKETISTKQRITTTVDMNLYLWAKKEGITFADELEQVLRLKKGIQDRSFADEQELLERIADLEERSQSVHTELISAQLELRELNAVRKAESQERLAKGRAMVDALRASGRNR